MCPPASPFLCTNLSWPSILTMMQKLVVLMDPISEHLLLHPHMGHLALSPEEWAIAKEICGVLELFKYVSTAIEDGTTDGFLGRSIFLCNTLLHLVSDGTTRIIDRGAAEASSGHKSISDLHATTAKFIEVAIDELKQSKVNMPQLEVELVGMFLDPRYKSLDGDDSGGGDHTERLRVALTSLRNGLKDGTATGSPSLASSSDSAPAAGTPSDPAPAAGATSTHGKRPAEPEEDPFAAYSRKRKKRAAAAAAAAAAGCTLASRFDKEVGEYKLLPEAVGTNFSMLSFWDDAGRPRLDQYGNVLEVATFPILAMLARVLHSADTTISQPQRDLSAVVLCMRNLRQSVRRDRVDMMAFLKMNQGMIPEVRSYAQMMDEKVQSEGHDKAVRAAADGAGEKLVVVQ